MSLSNLRKYQVSYVPYIQYFPSISVINPYGIVLSGSFVLYYLVVCDCLDLSFHYRKATLNLITVVHTEAVEAVECQTHNNDSVFPQQTHL